MEEIDGCMLLSMVLGLIIISLKVAFAGIGVILDPAQLLGMMAFAIFVAAIALGSILLLLDAIQLIRRVLTT